MTAARELARLWTLKRYEILDTPPDEAFDRLTRLGSRLLNVPICLVSLVDENRQWFKSRVGLDASETPREHAFCAHAITGTDVFQISDAAVDERFASNPLVTGAPHIRFYAGAPLLTSGGAIGTFCVIDRTPRTLSQDKQELLVELAAVVVDRLELSLVAKELQLRSELQRSNRALAEFASVAAHELQAPLRTVSNFTRLIAERRHLVDEATASQWFDFIQDGTAQMAGLIDGLLEYARVDNEGAKPHENVDLNDVLERIQRDLHGMLIASGGRLEYGELPTISGGEAALRGLLQNLIINGLKFSKKPPYVRITAKQVPGAWQVSVEDSGIGIPEEQRKQVFKMFGRLDSSQDYPGSGIGLAICQEVVSRHGGEIWVEGNQAGGATFIFTIPDVKAPPHT